MGKSEDQELLNRISKMLADGLKTKTEPFPETSKEFNKIVAELQQVDKSDIEQKLIISGYVNHPVNDTQCLECMYFMTHRKWCNLPEIDLPCEADWWCRLWRI